MDTDQFLARVLPPVGSYQTLVWSNLFKGKKYFHTRSYPLGQHAAMAGMADYLARRGCDVYHALASFTTGEIKADRQGRQYIEASRVVPNAHSLKVFIVDCDVMRQDDTKKGFAFPDRLAALAWIHDFITRIQLPPPNLVVDSGHGFHFYWTLADALPVAQWQPLAAALKAALLAQGWQGDTGPTVDAARILRPPGTVNLKSGTAVPVTVAGAGAADYPNATIIQALAPYIGQHGRAHATGTHGATHGGTSSAHAPASASVHPLGPRPAGLPPPDPALASNAAAGVVQRPYRFENIHPACEQLRRTWETHGADQSRDHWRLGDLVLLAHCVDGDAHVHRISDGYAGYTDAETEREYAGAKQAAGQGIGPPLCTSYDAYRPGVCAGCKWHGKLASPLTLGLQDHDLPANYRRALNPARIEVLSGSGKDERWDTLILGDVHTPLVQELPGGGHEIIFTYVLGPKEYVLAVRDYTVGSPVNLQPLLAKDGITCTRHEADGLGGLAVAWINKLRSAGQVHDQLIARPFGWNFLNGACTGLAIGGVLYRPGGMVERVACDDKKLAATYRPMGELAVWRRAAHLFEGKRPDLQALIACAFGAPLISLTGDVRGMTLNFWSAGSGIGKSTAIKIGQSVWGNYTAMQSMRDTPNSVMRSLAGPRVLIRYWDEFRITRDRQGEFVELVYTLPQGKERMRLMADITIRETGEWDTMLAMTSNKSHADVLLLDNDGTDSGLLRLLEIEMDKQMMPFDAAAGPLIKATETNYGHAGRIYAAYLGAQVDAVRLQLAAVSETLGRDLNLQQDERYYAAAIATIVVGATIACHLDLFAFDVHAIYDVLKRAVIASRSARQVRTVVTGAGRYELGPIMAQFINAMGDHLIRTDVLATAGSGKVTPIVTPKSSSIIKAQIAEKAGMIRLHREEFFRWLAVRNLPSAPVLDQMGQDWNARQKRAALAGGTSYATGQLWVVDVPRGDPELEAYFDTGGRP